MNRPLPEPIERAVRPFLPIVVKQAGELGRAPSDYFLVLGKYDPSKGSLIPRAAVVDFLALAKSEARRRKYERFLALPCEPNDLLVLVCAGDHVEGHRVRVPRVVPGAGKEEELPVSESTARTFLELTQEWLTLGYDGIREIGENPSEYINYVEWPPRNGDRGSRVFPRSKVSEELRHLHGTKKYAQLLEHLETPCDDVMLVMDVAGREDIVVFWRDRDKIPPFEVGKLNIKRKADGASDAGTLQREAGTADDE
ncbi:MAG: hypothetical protein ACLQVI_29005 [Polyangiaceae bacterium]